MTKSKLDELIAEGLASQNPQKRREARTAQGLLQTRADVVDVMVLAHVGAAVVLALRDGRPLDLEELLVQLQNTDRMLTVSPIITTRDSGMAVALLRSLAPGNGRP